MNNQVAEAGGEEEAEGGAEAAGFHGDGDDDGEHDNGEGEDDMRQVAVVVGVAVSEAEESSMNSNCNAMMDGEESSSMRSIRQEQEEGFHYHDGGVAVAYAHGHPLHHQYHHHNIGNQQLAPYHQHPGHPVMMHPSHPHMGIPVQVYPVHPVALGAPSAAGPQLHPPHFAALPQPPPPPPPPPMMMNEQSHVAMAQLHLYEARMRDHAVAYATAAAGAAWAAAQIAAYAATTASVSSPPSATQQQQHSNSSAPQWQLPAHASISSPAPSGSSFPPYFDPSATMAFQYPQPYQQQVSNQECFEEGQQQQQQNHNYNREKQQQPQDHQEQLGDPRHRRKRQQLRPPPSDNIPRNVMAAAGAEPSQQRQQQPLNHRQRQQQQQSYQQQYHAAVPLQQQQQQYPTAASAPYSAPSIAPMAASAAAAARNPKIRRRLRSSLGDCDNSSSSGSSLRRQRTGGSSSSRLTHNKKKARSDESLLGKTAVSALYEWCSKERHRPTPIFRQVVPGTTTTAPGTAASASGEPYMDDTSSAGGGGSSSAPAVAVCQGEFEFIVLLEEEEWGRGRGRTKAAARQEAARRALQALVPGVIFDDATGILVELPPLTPQHQQQQKQQQHHFFQSGSGTGANMGSPPQGAEAAATSTSHDKAALEDLAPNLARRLAIGRDDDDIGEHLDSKKRLKPSQQQQQQQPKRTTLSVYPGTSTTDEEDESTYYASRGASVCSALLHAMIQIDPRRFPQPPEFTFENAPVPTASGMGHNDGPSVKRKAAVTSGSSGVIQDPQLSFTRVTRGPFTCTARLRIIANVEQEEEILEASGVGCTKREARHVASAKLLSLLFPECDGNMVEVKAAAEAARENYAASKALKQQQQGGSLNSRRGRGVDSLCTVCRDPFGAMHENAPISRAFSHPSDPPLPLAIEDELRSLLGWSRLPENGEDVVDEGGYQENCDSSLEAGHNSGMIFRQLSRQKQIDAEVEAALQAVNERDEEGRSLPEELTVDDVGRTVLRRGLPEDISRIKKLLLGGTRTRSCSAGRASDLSSPSCSKQWSRASFNTEESALEENDVNGYSISPSRLWSSSSVVLLLCRAISAYEDPPLGCAVLTLGFSFERGRLLVVAQLASEPHLPRERFVECLQDFAHAMKCSLEVSSTSTEVPLSPSSPPFTAINSTEKKKKILGESDLTEIVKSYLGHSNKCRKSETSFGSRIVASTNSRLSEGALKAVSSSPLQSVREESEVSDSSNGAATETRQPSQRATKPSKRSRVE